MCDLSRAEQGSLTSLLSDLQAARGSLSATYPEIFSRAWADLEAMLAALDDMADAADRVRAWITAKHQPVPASPVPHEPHAPAPAPGSAPAPATVTTPMEHRGRCNDPDVPLVL
jgi:hypothetical protein